MYWIYKCISAMTRTNEKILYPVKKYNLYRNCIRLECINNINYNEIIIIYSKFNLTII